MAGMRAGTGAGSSDASTPHLRDRQAPGTGRSMVERIALLHSRLQLTLTALMAALVIWALICALRGRVGQGYIGALWVAQLLIVAQCGLGALLLARNLALAGPLALHLIYGIVALLLLPGAMAYNRERAGRGEALVFATICLMLLVVVARAYETAR